MHSLPIMHTGAAPPACSSYAPVVFTDTPPRDCPKPPTCCWITCKAALDGTRRWLRARAWTGGTAIRMAPAPRAGTDPTHVAIFIVEPIKLGPCRPMHGACDAQAVVRYNKFIPGTSHLNRTDDFITFKAFSGAAVAGHSFRREPVASKGTNWAQCACDASYTHAHQVNIGGTGAPCATCGAVDRVQASVARLSTSCLGRSSHKQRSAKCPAGPGPRRVPSCKSRTRVSVVHMLVRGDLRVVLELTTPGCVQAGSNQGFNRDEMT